MRRIILISACVLLCACSTYKPGERRIAPEPDQSGSELFYSDSLNARFIYRTYPVPDAAYTPAPAGYRPVYISTYSRHGSRKLHRADYSGDLREALTEAGEAGCLTPLGKEILAKVTAIDEDLQGSVGELTEVGVAQHRGIAQRMYRNYRNVFRHGAEIRLYSTVIQRTMMSMFACDEALVRLDPKLCTKRTSSETLDHLRGSFPDPFEEDPHKPADDFIRDYLDTEPILGRIFTEGAPALRDTAVFVRDLYLCASITPDLDIEDVDYLWETFTHEELFTLQQALSYMIYARNSNSPLIGDQALPAMRPLLKDFTDRADAALAKEVPGADLRFGHDSYLVPFEALVGIGGIVRPVEDRLKVIDTFRDFTAAPMAGNVQMVFYRNRAGDTLVKVLLNEVETWIPVVTDIYPYYHWSDVRDYFISLTGD